MPTPAPRHPNAKPRSTAAAARWLAAAVLLGASAPAVALEVPAGEADALAACERQVCTTILEKKPATGSVTCAVSKTWASDTIKGGENKQVKWGFGDAQCKTDVALSRSDIIAALTKPKHTLRMSRQAVSCVIERDGELKPLKAVASPKLEFKDGRADKVWINLEEIDGPGDIKSTVWTAASLEDTLGIFHKNMIKQINKFIYKRCDEKYGPGAAIKAALEAKREAARKARAKAAEAKAKKAAAAPAGPKPAAAPAGAASP